MSVVIDGRGGDRQKPLHAELNLVPYIDLLTCMVAFLLIAAGRRARIGVSRIS